MTAPGPGVGPQRHFFDLLGAGRFELPRCDGCAAAHFPPRSVCPCCGGTSFNWAAASGRGVVHATTTVRRPEQAGGDHNVCLIDLDDGVRLMSQIDAVASPDVRIGMRVAARVVADGAVPHLAFEPVRAPEGPV
jgi:uncharacterized OB-fold protein